MIRSTILSVLLLAGETVSFMPPTAFISGTLSQSTSRVFGNTIRSCASPGKTRLYTSARDEEAPAERLGSTKLVYDSRRGRFFEKETEEICRDEFCAVDENGQPFLLTVEEKERIFLDCIQSYYYSGRQMLSDEEFNRLKEDLIWEGSPVAILNRNETLFLNAMSTYLKGEPIMSDDEFDALKRSLKESGSLIAVNTEPKCYVDKGICSVTYRPDKWRMLILSVPGVLFASTVFLVGSYELIQPMRAMNPIFSLALCSPAIYFTSKFLTENVFFKNPLIAYGPCPACNAENRIFFGDILGVQGPEEVGEMKCKNCGVESKVVRSNLRVTTLDSKSGDQEAKPAMASTSKNLAVEDEK